MSKNVIAVETSHGQISGTHITEAILTGNKHVLISERVGDEDCPDTHTSVLVSPEFIKQIARYIELNSDAWKTIDGNN